MCTAYLYAPFQRDAIVGIGVTAYLYVFLWSMQTVATDKGARKAEMKQCACTADAVEKG